MKSCGRISHPVDKRLSCLSTVKKSRIHQVCTKARGLTFQRRIQTLSTTIQVSDPWEDNLLREKIGPPDHKIRRRLLRTYVKGMKNKNGNPQIPILF